MIAEIKTNQPARIESESNGHTGREAISEEPDFVRTGPGTVAGRYLRQYWQPVLLSRELGKGKVLPVRVMSEDFTAYRDEAGVAHVVEARCPHRRTLLSTALVKGQDIVCQYHGWRFAPNGACLDQPAERKPFCKKVTLATYPTKEVAGLVFAYFGDGPEPTLPEWPEVGDFPYRHRIDCNYFQSAENVMDDSHVPFLHRRSLLQNSTRMAVPRVSAYETDFGLSLELRHLRSVEYNHFVMPNLCYVVDQHAWGVRFHLMMAYVPIDDTSHNHFFSATTSPRAVGKAMASLTFGLDRMKKSVDGWFTETVNRILSGALPVTSTLSPRVQDSVMVVGQGALTDRSNEHLGPSDAAVILLRRIWRSELRRFAAGESVKRYARPRSFPPRSVLLS